MFGQKPPIEKLGTGKIRGFDDFEISLGDVMRGERATLGMSLLDVQRVLRIDASIIHAIEQCNISGVTGDGFVPGMVRSYAKYLGIDPDWAYEEFCKASGYSGVNHALNLRKRTTPPPSPATGTTFSAPYRQTKKQAKKGDPLERLPPSFTLKSKPFHSWLDLSAIRAVFGLVALLSVLGYGTWYVLAQIQQIEIIPAESIPEAIVSLDAGENVDLVSQRIEASGNLDQIYKRDILKEPVVVLRDKPIGGLNPESPDARLGHVVLPEIAASPLEQSASPSLYASEQPSGANLEQESLKSTPIGPALAVIAARPVWVQVHDADGNRLFETIMKPGEHYIPPSLDRPAILKVGQSGAVYFLANGKHLGPVGARGKVTSGIELSSEALQTRFSEADMKVDPDLEIAIARLLIEEQYKNILD